MIFTTVKGQSVRTKRFTRLKNVEYGSDVGEVQECRECGMKVNTGNYFEFDYKGKHYRISDSQAHNVVAHQGTGNFVLDSIVMRTFKELGLPMAYEPGNGDSLRFTEMEHMRYRYH